jgi:uncharacterized membrane protein
VEITVNKKETIIKRIGGYLHKVTPIVDSTGKVIHSIVTPFQVELKPRDIFQMIVGSYLLCVPVAMSEEVWVLSRDLAFSNIIGILLLSLFFVSSFVYFNYYRYHLKGHWLNFLKRIIATYAVSFIAVGLFLTLIDKCPWNSDYFLAIKRIVLVAFPSTMAATLSDTIK